GVQTCALPISKSLGKGRSEPAVAFPVNQAASFSLNSGFFRMLITSGIVVTAPTAARAQPAPFRSSSLNLSESNNPMPTPSAIRVPAINMISGIVNPRSPIKHLCLKYRRRAPELQLIQLFGGGSKEFVPLAEGDGRP